MELIKWFTHIAIWKTTSNTDNVCQNRCCCWFLTSTWTVIHRFTDTDRFNKDCIHNIVDASKWVIFWQECWWYFCWDTWFYFTHITNQFDNITQFLSNSHIVCRDVRNAFVRNVVKINCSTKTKLAKDNSFISGVIPFNVVGWITFSITKFLSSLEGVLIWPTFINHLSHHKVRCTVKHTKDTSHLVRCQRVSQSTQNWNTTGNSSFIVESHTLILSKSN